MPTESAIESQEPSSIKDQLFDAVSTKDLTKIKELIDKNPKIELDCVDKDELSPLQHTCHNGDLELARFLLDHGADVNFTRRKDRYTPLMFAAISSRKEVVRLLLERGVDITVENCVNRTAAQMAAFVGQSKIVSIINSWISYENSVAPYTKCRELETEPRIPSKELGKLLHEYIVYPSIHPVKLLLYIKSQPELIQHSNEFIYVLENLSSKSLKPPSNDETLSLKYYYLSYLIDFCVRNSKCKTKDKDEIDMKLVEKFMDVLIRRLIKRDDPDDIKPCTQHLDLFILECLLKFPYTQLAIFKTMTFALTKRDPGDLTALSTLIQTLNGPRMFSHPPEACAICGEVDKNKKCSKCKSIYYCSSSCQTTDWFQHKKVCKSLDERPLLKDTDDNEQFDAQA